MSCTTAPAKSMVGLQAQVFPLKMETEYTPVSTSVVDELGDSIYGERSGWVFAHIITVRIVTATLFAAAVFSGLAAITGSNHSHSLSSALSCAVCATATVHYLAILMIRNQMLPRLLRSLTEDLQAHTSADPVSGHNVREVFVDSMRYSDWLVTLPLLGFELRMVLTRDDAQGHGSPWLSSTSTVLLLVAVVVSGAIFRFAGSELRPSLPNPAPRGGKHADNAVHQTVGNVGFLIGVAAWIASATAFMFVVVDLWTQAGRRISASDGVADDARFVQWVLASWFIYPATSIIVVVVLITQRVYTSIPYPETLSLFKDVAFGIGDVFAKAILAFYVASNTLNGSATLATTATSHL